ncbi:MAG: cytochrome c oxidase subunit 3 family protein [Myxococcales bacterium]
MTLETAHLAHHFEDLPKQEHAARLGMWLFLGTEALLFGALFAGYFFYRFLFEGSFALASQHLDLAYGTINTFVLITSSFTVAMGLHFVKHGSRRWALAALSTTLLCALAFLAIKGFEWADDFRKGIYPGPYYAQASLQIPGASLFYTFYFLMAGLHGVHVVVGFSVLSWMTFRVAQGRYHRGHSTPLELGAMYWHLVDIIWIFLYPFLYLVT